MLKEIFSDKKQMRIQGPHPHFDEKSLKFSGI
jgi:hypothetical protein